MSVTVSDLLKLPSLRQARVIGGAGGLKKVVSSISVLESTDPGVLINEVFHHNKYSGSEIVITGFLNCVNDVDLLQPPEADRRRRGWPRAVLCGRVSPLCGSAAY